MTLILSDEEGPALAAAARIRPQAADPLAPPPPEPRNRWDWPVTVFLALLINAFVLSGLFLHPAGHTKTRPPEPKTISVDLVKQPPQPKPQQQPQPEQKRPEEKKTEQKKDKIHYAESGGSSDLKQGRAPKPEAKETRQPPKPEARVKTPKPPKFTIPDWARLPDGGDLPEPDKEESTSEDSAAPVKLINSVLLGEGGGDAYLNAMRDQIKRNIVYPPGACGRRGIAVWGMVVSHAGIIKDIELLRSSGSPDLDDAARLAIERTAPFDPLPDNYANTVQIVAPVKVEPGS